MVALQAKSVSAENNCRCRRLGGYHRRSGKSLVEVGGEVDEVRDSDTAVVIHIAIAISCVALPEVGRQRGKVGDRHLAIAIQIAFEREERPPRHGRNFVAGRVGDDPANQVHLIVPICYNCSVTWE